MVSLAFFMRSFPTMQKDLWHMWVHPNGVETTGALDLGGASTQISFAVGEKVELNSSDVMKVSLYGYVYTLYTRSFQCYGRNEAEKRFLAILLQVLEPGAGGVAAGVSLEVTAEGGALPSGVSSFHSS